MSKPLTQRERTLARLRAANTARRITQRRLGLCRDCNQPNPRAPRLRCTECSAIRTIKQAGRRARVS